MNVVHFGDCQDDKRMTTTLLPCPNCGGAADHYPNSDGQANAIYCQHCPVGVEDSRMTDFELVSVWNSLPRRREPCGERHLKQGERCDICGAIQQSKASK